MERLIRSTRSIDSIIRRVAEEFEGPVLGPALGPRPRTGPEPRTGPGPRIGPEPRISPEPRRERDMPNYSFHFTNRDLLIHYLQLLTSRQTVGALIIAFEELTLYEEMLIDVAVENGTYLVVISPSATPLDKRPPRIIPLQNEDFNWPGKTLILCPSEEKCLQLIEERGAYRRPPKGESFLVASTRIDNAISGVFYDTIVVYGTVESLLYTEKGPVTLTNLHRSIFELSILAKRGKTIYGIDVERPYEENNRLYEGPIHDLTLIIGRYGEETKIPLSFLRSSLFLEAKETLQELGLMDSYGFPTNTGRALNEELGTYAGLFLYQWKRDFPTRFLFPGYVMASILSVLFQPHLLSYGEGRGEEEGGGEGGTTFEQYLRIWHDLTLSLGERVMEDNTVIEWCREKEIEERQVLFLVRRIRRLSVGVSSYGLFTVEGGIERALPLLRRIYSPFYAKRERDGYRSSEGELFFGETGREEIGVLLVRDNTILSSLPLGPLIEEASKL